jgi:hypothetical protein
MKSYLSTKELMQTWRGREREENSIWEERGHPLYREGERYQLGERENLVVVSSHMEGVGGVRSATYMGPIGPMQPPLGSRLIHPRAPPTLIDKGIDNRAR